MVRQGRLVGMVTLVGLAIGPSLKGQVASPGVPQDTLSQEQVVREVVAHNDRAAAMQYMEAAANAKIGPAGAWDDPMLMLGVNNVPTSFDFRMDPMTMKMVGLSQNIPYAGQKGLASKAARADAAASTDDKQTVQLELAATARTAYAELYYRRKALAYLASQYELLDGVVASTRAKLIANQATQDELLAAQAEQWRMQAQLVMAESDAQEAGFKLNALRGRAAAEAIPPLARPLLDSIPKSVDPWLSSAQAHYPPLQKLRHKSESYGFSAGAARRMSWPMLGLSASYGIRESTEMEKRDNMLSFQATVSLPLFSGRSQRQMARSMEAMKKSSDAEASQLWRDVEAALSALHQHAEHYQENVKMYDSRIIPASEDAFRGALAGYQTNRTSLTTVLSYALAIYRDRLGMLQQANNLARTMAEAEKYAGDPGAYSSSERH
ncbi:MAG: TolC family protein [Candidatus Zixiibacteriota bacterium]